MLDPAVKSRLKAPQQIGSARIWDSQISLSVTLRRVARFQRQSAHARPPWPPRRDERQLPTTTAISYAASASDACNDGRYPTSSDAPNVRSQHSPVISTSAAAAASTASQSPPSSASVTTTSATATTSMARNDHQCYPPSDRSGANRKRPYLQRNLYLEHAPLLQFSNLPTKGLSSSVQIA